MRSVHLMGISKNSIIILIRWLAERKPQFVAPRKGFMDLCLHVSFLCLFIFINGCQQKVEEKIVDENDPKFSEHIRTTSFRTPEEERRGFKLPPGFEITLFASEPDISKPINIAFDAKGRLWVTHSSEYPIPAATGSGKDKITILEDTNGDGKADKFTDFADDLNIPIGIMPVPGGAIGYSIPNVYMFHDRDGDGKSENREVLIGPFGHHDTHGMINNLLRGLDGWIHSSHGFSNISTIAGKDGDSIHMVSGNTWRFRMDGSRVEQTTFGRVNPFGFAYDDLGYLYSADCHTMPIYQIIRDGNYPHFGKKPPGLGFGPKMMEHQIGSTALAGLIYYQGDAFPEEYRNSFYSGDVVKCKVSRNTLSFDGSTPQATLQKDFLLSDDPWFRPVDIKIGPDGAMYIADFYNRIIGHYEVPLNHPGRDRSSGRIWRITYKGGKKQKLTDWTQKSLDELLNGLDDANITVRLMVADEIADRFGVESVPSLKKIVADTRASSRKISHALWLLKRLDSLEEAELVRALNHEDREIRVHAFRVLAEYESIKETFRTIIEGALNHSDPHTRRAAADILVRHPDQKYFQSLLNALDGIADNDTHLRYTVMIALRNHLQQPAILNQVMAQEWNEKQARVLMEVMVDVPSPVAATFLYANLKKYEPSTNKMAAYLESVGRFIPLPEMVNVIRYTRDRFKDDPVSQLNFYTTIKSGIDQRGGLKDNKPLREWVSSFAGSFIANLDAKPELPPDKPETEHNESDAFFNDLMQRMIFAANVAREYKITAFEQSLTKLLTCQWASAHARAVAGGALVEMSPAGLKVVEERLNNKSEPVDFRERLAMEAGKSVKAKEILKRSVREAPSNVQLAIAVTLVNSTDGVDYLLKSVKDGFVPARLLLDRKINERLTANLTTVQKREYDALTADVDDLVAERQQLIDTRLKQFDITADITKGKQVFVTNCGICHQVKNEGGLIGPQLDGIGNWGLHALIEKILDPNRNITEAFRTYNITMKDGKVVSGLYRRDDGEVEVYANVSGEEFTVSKSEITEKRASQTTLMPDQFGETLSKEDFDALLVYLLREK